jgi:phosphoglycerate dehydrogenase-like enzyme
MNATDPIHVLVAMDFDDALIEQLRAVSPRLVIERHWPEVPARAWAEAEVLYTLKHYPEPDQAPRLRWIQLHHAGVDRVMKKLILQAEDVEVTTASGVHAVQMAEYCLMMMLAFTYRLPRLLQLQAEAIWPDNVEDSLTRFAPLHLRGRTLGIAGYGSVGRELARLAQALGMTVLATKRDLKHAAAEDEYAEAGTGDHEGAIPARLYPPEALRSMASLCDFLVLTLPLTDSTRGIVNEEVLHAMKPTAVLINVARGGVVDETALIAALAAERIAGAALDVFVEEPLPRTHPFWNLENVILTPHISGNSARYHEKVTALFIENLRRYLERRPLLNRVDRKRGY